VEGKGKKEGENRGGKRKNWEELERGGKGRRKKWGKAKGRGAERTVTRRSAETCTEIPSEHSVKGEKNQRKPQPEKPTQRSEPETSQKSNNTSVLKLSIVVYALCRTRRYCSTRLGDTIWITRKRKCNLLILL